MTIMSNPKANKLVDMLGVPNELYCAANGTKYTANSEGRIFNVADTDRGDLVKLGAEVIKPPIIEPEPASAFEHNKDADHQAGDVLQK